MKKILKLMVILIAILTTSNAVVPTDIQWPVKKDLRDTSIFFDVEDAVEAVHRTCGTNKQHFPAHLGIDIRTKDKTQVFPTYSGKVVRIGSDGGWGAYIVLSHNKGKWTSVYWHLKDIRVDKGDTVTKKTVLGEVMDTSGLGDVSHLHFGIRPKPYSSQYSKKGIGLCDNNYNNNHLYGFENPLKYLPHRGYALIDDEDARHFGTWRKSVSTDFYSGKGYSVAKEQEGVGALYTYILHSTGKYSIYTKFPVAENRTKKAKYKIYVDGKYYNYRYVDQSKDSNRGKNVYLYSVTGKKGQKIWILLQNGVKKDYLVSDAILFRKR